MKIAIPIHDDCVSNVFDFATRLVLVDIDQDSNTHRSEIDMAGGAPTQRVRQLTDSGANVLICGAISRVLAGMLAAADIEVLPYVTGRVDDVLQAYVAGELIEPRFAMPHCQGRARKGFQWGHRGRGSLSRRFWTWSVLCSPRMKGQLFMNIAITAQGKELSSEIDLRFGRAQWLLVVDTETGDCQAHDNTVNLNGRSRRRYSDRSEYCRTWRKGRDYR